MCEILFRKSLYWRSSSLLTALIVCLGLTGMAGGMTEDVSAIFLISRRRSIISRSRTRPSPTLSGEECFEETPSP